MPVLPETLLFLSVVLSLIVAVYTSSGRAKARADRFVYVGLLASFCTLCLIKVPDAGLFTDNRLFVLDKFSVWLKKLILLGAFIGMLFGVDWLKYKKYTRFEFAPLLGFSVTGMMLTISSDSFLMQFLGLEMMHFPLLFLTAYKRVGERSTEAGTKYVVVMFLSSGLYLFGVSVIYACLGTMDFLKIAAADKNEIMSALLWGISFITAGMLLKIGAAPFHSWVADVYEGAPSPVTALFAMIVRTGVIAAFARIVLGPFADLSFYWRPVLMTVGLLSVGIGSFGAIVQISIKRLTAYTAIVLNGFSLSVLIAGGTSLLLMLLTTDLILTAGMAAIVLSLRIGDELNEKIKVLNGQGQSKPVRGALFSLIFLGISGAPPFAGFWARFSLFQEITRNGRPVFSALLMAVGLLITYVYFRLIRQMYASSAKEELSFAPAPMKAVIILSAFLSVFFFAFMEPLGGIFQTAVLSRG